MINPLITCTHTIALTQGMLSGSLRALDGSLLQHTLGKLNEEERQREWGRQRMCSGGGRAIGLDCC